MDEFKTVLTPEQITALHRDLVCGDDLPYMAFARVIERAAIEEYKRLRATSAEPVQEQEAMIREALEGMQRWFGKWPEFVPADGKMTDAAQAVAAMNTALKGDRTSAPIAAQAQPVAFLRATDLDRLGQPHVAGCAASLEKRPREGFIPIYITAP